MSSIHDLLPIPQGTESPNAYDVFGITPGEDDLHKITTSVVTVIDRLKSIKSQCDPELWEKAARMVDHSRQILSDPKLKSELDSKLQQAGSTDPLAGLIPLGDPLAPIEAFVPVSPSQAVQLPAGSFGTAVQPKTTSTLSNSGNPVATQIIDRRGSSSPRRRKGSSVGKLMLGLLTLCLLTTTGLLAYLVLARSGNVRVASSNDQTPIVPNQPNIADRVAKIPTAVADPLPGGDTTAETPDPVMGELSKGPQDRGDQFGRSSGIADRSANDNFAVTGNVDQPEMIKETGESATIAPDPSLPTAPLPDPATPNSVTPDPATPDPAAPDPAAPDPPAPDPTTPTMDLAAQKKELDQVRQLIRSAKWDKMKSAAESLADRKLSDKNASAALGLYQLADLATYYRGGIARAVKALDVGNDFEVTDTFRVIVVEKGDDRLTVRYNKQNRSFTLDQFPFSLAHRLASFEVPDSATGRAAKAAYQAIAPKATDGHRDESIDWLKEIDGKIDGADRDRLITAIGSMYQAEKE